MAIQQLKAKLGPRVSTAPADLAAHGKDESYPRQRAPLAVVYAESTSDIEQTLEWARTHLIPIIAFGADTSLEGHVVPVSDAVGAEVTNLQECRHGFTDACRHAEVDFVSSAFGLVQGFWHDFSMARLVKSPGQSVD